MSSIDTRSPFFPKGRNVQTESTQGGSKVGGFPEAGASRSQNTNGASQTDAKVNIPDGVRDFSRIKKAATNAPEVDNSDKIARLKAQIQAGTYDIDYDALADKMLQSEF